MRKIDEVKTLPNLFYRNQENRLELWGSVIKCHQQPSREIPDVLTIIMSNMHTAGVRFQPHVLDWHQFMGDDDSRSLRNYLRSDGLGGPKYDTKNWDFLEYLNRCQQYIDPNYRQHVYDWCLAQIFNNDEDF